MRLIELVERYAREPHHRSGTDAERRSRDWLVAELEARGLGTRQVEFEFPRFDADWSLSLDDRLVEDEPSLLGRQLRAGDGREHREREHEEGSEGLHPVAKRADR